MRPKNPQSFTLTIVRTLRNALKHAIAPTGLTFGVAAGGPSVGKATCDTRWLASSPSKPHLSLGYPTSPPMTPGMPVTLALDGVSFLLTGVHLT